MRNVRPSRPSTSTVNQPATCSGHERAVAQFDDQNRRCRPTPFGSRSPIIASGQSGPGRRGRNSVRPQRATTAIWPRGIVAYGSRNGLVVCGVGDRIDCCGMAAPARRRFVAHVRSVGIADDQFRRIRRPQRPQSPVHQRTTPFERGWRGGVGDIGSDGIGRSRCRLWCWVRR